MFETTPTADCSATIRSNEIILLSNISLLYSQWIKSMWLLLNVWGINHRNMLPIRNYCLFCNSIVYQFLHLMIHTGPWKDIQAKLYEMTKRLLPIQYLIFVNGGFSFTLIFTSLFRGVGIYSDSGVCLSVTISVLNWIH